MTITIPVHRALSSKLAGRSFHTVTRFGYNPWLARVNYTASDCNDIKSTPSRSQSGHIAFIATRSYATTTAAKPVGRPKAHTGRAPAKARKAPATKKKPGPKTAAGKKKVGRKPKAKKAKAKSKAKPKPRVKKAPSKSALTKARVAKEKDLKERALLDEPKKLPESVWKIIFTEEHKGHKDFQGSSEITKTAAQKFRNLSPEEKEHYNHLATANKTKNDTDFKKWLSKFTPDQIRDANNARSAMRRTYIAKHPEKKGVTKFSSLKDDRLPKRAVTSYALFAKERHATGDYKNMTIAESSKLLSREWKELDAASKSRLTQEYKADQGRYEEEVKTVFK